MKFALILVGFLTLGCKLDMETLSLDVGDCLHLTGKEDDWVFRVYETEGWTKVRLRQHSTNDTFDLGWYGSHEESRIFLARYFSPTKCPADRKGW